MKEQGESSFQTSESSCSISKTSLSDTSIWEIENQLTSHFSKNMYHKENLSDQIFLDQQNLLHLESTDQVDNFIEEQINFLNCMLDTSIFDNNLDNTLNLLFFTKRSLLILLNYSK